MTKPELQLLPAYIGTRVLLSRITAKHIGGFLTGGGALAPYIYRRDISNSIECCQHNRGGWSCQGGPHRPLWSVPNG